MPGMSNSLANAVINWSLRAQAAPTIRTTYFALFKADPTDAFTAGTEVDRTVNTWYGRKPTGAFASPANGVTYNSTSVSFDPVTDAGVTVTHIGIVEGANATDATATLLYSQALSVVKVMTTNDQYAVISSGTSGDFNLTMV